MREGAVGPSEDTGATSALPDFRLGHRRINLEIIKARLNALTGVRPFLLGHMGSGVPHLHAVGNVTVMDLLR